MTFRLDARLPVALRAAGINVVELGIDGVAGKNWLKRSRDFTALPIGQANHWDAIGPINPERWSQMLQTFARFGGAATYNGGVFDDGTVYLWSAGRSVNVGKVDSRTLKKVRAKQRLTGNPRSGDMYGNAYFLGWVIRNTGSEPIPVAQMNSLVTLNAICCDLYGLDPVTSITHAELTSRKSDIKGLDITSSVVQTLAKMRAPKPPPPKPPVPPVRVSGGDWARLRGVIQQLESDLDEVYKNRTGQAADTAGRSWWIEQLDAAYVTGGLASAKQILKVVDGMLRERNQ